MDSLASSSRSLRARLAQMFTPHLRYQIIVPYLLLATVFVVAGTYLLTNAASQSLHERFNRQLLDAARGGANTLAQAETQQLAGLRLMLFTRGLPEAVAGRDAAAARAVVVPLAINNGLDVVTVVGADAVPLITWAAAGEAPAAAPADPALVALVQAALHPAAGANDKVSAVVGGPGDAIFYTAGPVIQAERVVGAILVGTPLPHLLRQVQRSSLSDGAGFYRADGPALGYTLAASETVAGALPALPAGWYAAIHDAPAADVRYRTLTLDGSTYLEALSALPGRGLAGTPGVYGVVLNARTLDAGLQGSLWTLVPLFGVGLVLIVFIGGALAARIDRPLRQLVTASEQVARGNLEVQVVVTRRDELGVLGRRFNEMVVGLRQLLFVKDVFGRFVSPEVSDQVLRGQIKLGGERRTVTILFSDLRDFTGLAEQYSPEAIVDLLNLYFSRVVQAAKRHGGIVNKFGGDSTLIVFGTPVAMPDHADRALATALEMRAALDDLNTLWSRDGWRPQRQGIGITTGQVVAGQIGSEDRMEYTVIGDPVNLAARIQGMVKTMPDVDIVFSGSTLEALIDPGAWQWRDWGMLPIRGKQEPVQIYNLLDAATADPATLATAAPVPAGEPGADPLLEGAR